MKATLLFTGIFLSAMNALAQKQRFDVVSYTAPKNWQQQQFEGGLQLSFTDKKTGAYAIALITKATASDAGANENFNADWNKLIKGSVQVSNEPALLEPANENGWDIVSGTANYTDGSEKGLATLLTATGGGQMASVVLMTNTDKYQDELLSFLHSLELAAPQNVAGTTTPAITQANKSSIVGLWIYYIIETSGYANGFPQPSGGYFRKEYTFYDDGTYLFRMKNWAVFVKEIQYVYETGDWKINGNKLTIAPKQGRGGWWSKSKTGRTNEWGSLVKNGDWKLEPVTYTMDLHYYPGVNETHLILQSGSQTEREGKQENNKLSFTPRPMGESLIDNPPGIKTGFENKELNTSTSSASKNSIETASSKAGAINPSITGLWIDYSPETSSNPYNTNYAGARNYTGGYRNKEYYFYPDGTYLYRKKYWVTTMTEILYTYETGTFNVKGNQLTINPQKGKGEWWSKVGGQTKAWGKFVKAAEHKLEKTIYTMEIKYFSESESYGLALKPQNPTARDGGQFNAPNEPYEFHYSSRKLESMIDNPPGYPTVIKTK